MEVEGWGRAREFCVSACDDAWCWCFFFRTVGDRMLDILYDADRAGGGAGRHPLVPWCGAANGMGWDVSAQGYVFVSLAACTTIFRTLTFDRLR